LHVRCTCTLHTNGEFIYFAFFPIILYIFDMILMNKRKMKSVLSWDITPRTHILSHVGVTIDAGLDWRIDLLDFHKS
jgi:hypothetical protein